MRKIDNIILIDDDPMVNMVNSKLMQAWSFGSTINSYMEPKKALLELIEQLKTKPAQFPDVILLDLNMPGMDGWEFLEKFEKVAKGRLNACKIIILSSSIDPKDIEHSEEHHLVCGFISKPLTLAKLDELCAKME